MLNCYRVTSRYFVAPSSLLVFLFAGASLIGCTQSNDAPAKSTAITTAVANDVDPKDRPPADAAPIAQEPDPDVATIHIREGEDIQAGLDKAAQDSIRRVVVHAGVYRPDEHRQSLIWFNKIHDGIHLLADGDVTLTSANPAKANPADKSYPCIANHVVYFGDGINESTKIEGFKITGANNYVTNKGIKIESADETELPRTGYFYTDGGGIKIYGHSYPTLESLEIVDNYSSPCGAGISIEHLGYNDKSVTIRNCIFQNNRVPLTGAALDLLDRGKGSAAIVENCLFVENLSNCSMDSRSLGLGSWMPEDGHGAITLFNESKAVFKNCTITQNRNGVDDLSSNTRYLKCIFWSNNVGGGWPTRENYETALWDSSGMEGCLLGGNRLVARVEKIDETKNTINAPDPKFDDRFAPQEAAYEGIGYRPVEDN